MAIAFAQVKYLSRSKALQATAAAAYRSCSKIHDERTGQTFDYTNKKSPLLYSEIILPENSDPRFHDRELLWNQVERVETRHNSQVAKEIILALPNEDAVTDEHKIELAYGFALTNFVSKGVAVDINIHNENNNPHAHILMTTRRLHGDQFDTHKARDLDPKVIRGRVQMDRAWGEEWRHFQNNYFLAKGLDLVVDANGIISQAHLGKAVFHAKDRANLDLWQLHQEAQIQAKQIALNSPESVINQLTIHHSIFSEHDIARLLNKHIDDPNEFQATMIKVKSAKQVISLGLGSDGKERFTSKALFELENNLQQVASKLNQCNLHPVRPTLINKVISHCQLNDEQAAAIRHISSDSDIAIMVGRAGTGKTYTLKAAKDIFHQAGYHVQGIALSGIAAQGLQDASGIPSRTIASFTHSLNKGHAQLSAKDVVIMDEAGMADTYALADVVNAVSQAKAKLILVGDDAQLQPIGPGAPFRALIEQVGYAGLQQITRQEEAWQRKATHHLASGKVKEALETYQDKGCIHFNETAKASMHALIEQWHNQYSSNQIPLKNILIMAHRNRDVSQLNQIARAKRILRVEIDRGHLVANKEEELWLSEKDRLLFLKNDNQLDIKNGQFGTVIAIEVDHLGLAKRITADLDNGKSVSFSPKQYPNFAHGYSATIHKTQGVTTDHSFVYVSGNHWNRNLLYVAGSRHKKTMDLFIDQETYSGFNALAIGLDQDGMKDSVLNYPLNFANRRGLDIEHLFERVSQHVINHIKTAADYLRKKYDQIVKHERTGINQSNQNDSQQQQGHKSSPLNTKEAGKEIDLNQTLLSKFEELHKNLSEAKKERNYYLAYRLKKELQKEAGKIYTNKYLIRVVREKLPVLAKAIERYYSKDLEYGHTDD